MKQLRWVSSQNIPGCEKCILASLEFPFFTHKEVSTEICITNAHFISRIPQKSRFVEEEQICFPLWTFSIHRDIIVIYGHEASWKHARSEVTNIYHRNVKLFFIRTQNSMFSRPSETSNIGIDQFTNRPIEYCEFVIMSILLFLETLTFKLFLGHGQHLQVLWCLSVFLTFISVQRYFSLEGSLFKASKRWRQFSQKCLYIVYWFINSQKALREAPFPPRWNNHFKIKSESWFPRCFYWVSVFLDF